MFAKSDSGSPHTNAAQSAWMHMPSSSAEKLHFAQPKNTKKHIFVSVTYATFVAQNYFVWMFRLVLLALDTNYVCCSFVDYIIRAENKIRNCAFNCLLTRVNLGK